MFQPRLNAAVSILFLLFISVFYTLKAQSVDLHWLDTQPKGRCGTSWGIPFSKGIIKKNQPFVLTDNNGVKLPLQTWPLAYWPDGSIKWLGCATVTQGGASYRLSVSGTPLKVDGIKAKSTADGLYITTGKLSCIVNTSGNVLIRSLQIEGKPVSENGRLVTVFENSTGETEQLIRREEYQSVVKSAVIEQSGDVRTVVKIDGVHKSKSSPVEKLPFTVRLYFYKDETSVKMVHTFIYDADQYQDFIKGMAIQFDVPLRESLHNRHVRFSGSEGGLWSESVKPLIGRSPFTFRGDESLPVRQFAGERLPEIDSSDSVALQHYTDFPAWNDYKLTQLGADGCAIAKRTNEKSAWLHADDGRRASGLALIGDVSGGMAISLKDFWQSYPAALEVNGARGAKARLSVWLWSKEAEAMDLRHYDTIPHGLNATYEDVQPGLSTPYGVARTSVLTLYPYAEMPSKERSVAWATEGAAPPLLVCSSQYLHDAKAFGIWSLPDRSVPVKRAIENQLDSAILYYQQSIDERHWYGFWNYGDVMHTYDAVRHVWRYDIGGFAWDNTELAPNNWLWFSFLRSGRADIFRLAEAMTRHTGEVDTYHLGELKGLGSRHNVSHWGCGSKEARIGQAAWKRYYYYLTTDERCGDLMTEALSAESAIVKYDPLRVAQPRDKYPYKGVARLRWGPDWLALAGNWMTAWERTGDTHYRDKIVNGLNGLSQLPDNLFTGPNGLSYDPVSGKISYDGKPNLTNRNHLATIMGGYEVLMELMDIVPHAAFRKTFTEYCRYYSMPSGDKTRTAATARWGDINFRTPRLTAFAAHELNDDQLAARAWSELLGENPLIAENRGLRYPYGSKVVTAPEVFNRVHENVAVGTNGTAQWGLNAMIMLELIGDKVPDAKRDAEKSAFAALDTLPWKSEFSDNFQKNWGNNWFLDGAEAEITKSKHGIFFRAGKNAGSDAGHAVLWSRRSFGGDLRLEFDFTRCDTVTRFVNILYLFAQGSGVGVYENDIEKWSRLRTIPAMKTYYEHMNAYHISFAAFENDNRDPSFDYIRCRRYLPERGKGLFNTDIKPEYVQTGLFKTGVSYHITVIRKGEELFMKIKSKDQELVCHWPTNQLPPLLNGRIGFRLMGSRASEFANVEVKLLKN